MEKDRVSFYTTEALLQALEAHRLDKGTAYQERDLPLLGRLLERLADAIATNTAPPEPKHDEPLYAGRKQTTKRFTLQRSPNIKALFVRFRRQSIQRTANYLLTWAIAIPTEREMSPEQFCRALRRKYGYAKLVTTRQLRQDFQGLQRQQLVALIEKLHHMGKIGVRWGSGDHSLVLDLPHTQSRACNRIELIMPLTNAKKIGLVAARTLLHRRKSVLTEDQFRDGLAFPFQINYSSEAVGILMPRQLAIALTTQSPLESKSTRRRYTFNQQEIKARATVLQVAQFSEPLDWNRKLRSVFVGLKEGAIDVVWLQLKDRLTEVAIVSPRAIDFEKWELIDSDIGKC